MANYSTLSIPENEIPNAFDSYETFDAPDKRPDGGKQVYTWVNLPLVSQ